MNITQRTYHVVTDPNGAIFDAKHKARYTKETRTIENEKTKVKKQVLVHEPITIAAIATDPKAIKFRKHSKAREFALKSKSKANIERITILISRVPQNAPHIGIYSMLMERIAKANARMQESMNYRRK